MKRLSVKAVYLVMIGILVSCGKINQNKLAEESDLHPIRISSSAITNFSKVDKNKILECRKHIAEIVCLVDPLDNDNPYSDQYNRPCLDGSEKYTKIFTEHFDHSSELIQKMYCSLEKIWIENSLATTAYASPILDMSNNLVAGAIGINKEFIENPESIDVWFSKKEETSFGGSHSNKSAQMNLIKYKSNQSTNKFSSIHYAINHEFGHLFDYANKLNRYDDDCNLDLAPEDCKPLLGSWGSISWINSKTPNPENYFSLREELCFYSCKDQFVDKSKSNLLFESLIQSGFQSSYASVNPKEDWAEAFALYLVVTNEKFKWTVETNGQSFNLFEHFNSEKLKDKKDFVKRFLNSDFKYPGTI